MTPIISMNYFQTGEFVEYTSCSPFNYFGFVSFGPSRFHGCLWVVAATAGQGAASRGVCASQNKSLSVAKNFIHCNTGKGLCTCYFPERRALQQVYSMANKQNGNPNLMQFQSFPPLLRVEILSLHIRTIHLPCMTKITSCVIFSPRESLHVSLCIIPLLKYCEMDEFCRAKQVKLFISAFSL